MTESGMDGMSMESLLALQEDLDKLEAQDENVRDARAKLDAAIDRLTQREAEARDAEEAARQERERVCEDCGVPNYTPHHETCVNYGKGPVREAGGYQYLNEDMEVIFTTSTPLTDKAALKYFEDLDRYFATSRLKYIWRRAMWQPDFLMMPYEWDRENKVVTLIGGTPIPEGQQL